MKRILQLTHGALVLSLVLGVGCGSASDATTPDESTGVLFDAPSVETTAPDAPLAIPEGSPTVAFLGDSLGAGLHLAEHQAFPALLQSRLLEDGVPFRLVNASESGRTTAGGAAALNWVLRSEPNLVVIELGGNDGLRGIPIAEIEKNLRKMIATARDASASVLLLGVRMPPNYGEYGADFDALYPRLAEELEVAFVPYFMEGVGGVPEMNLPDGLHPTVEGHEKLASNVISALRAKLLEGKE